MSVDHKKETQEVMKKNHIEGDNEFLTHGQSNDKKGAHGTPYDDSDSFTSHENVGPEIPVNCKCSGVKKVSRQEKAELCRKLQEALSYKNWELAESLITGSNMHMLNDALCMSLDSIWFLSTFQELNGLTALIKKIISFGACDFTRAALRTSFLASCVSACQSGLMSLAETVTFVAQRLQERLKECNGTEFLKKEASDKVLKFTEWAMKCIGIHQGSNDPGKQVTPTEVQFQLLAFRTFLDLAENQLTIRDFTEAFDAACFPLTLFSCSFDSGWASSSSSAAIKGLLNILADRGADNVNQCLLEAARFGSTEVVRMLLQVARLNSLPVDINLALSFAAYYCKFDTMNCLVEEGQASSFLAPLLKSSERGCIPVVSWFVNRGCSDMELCLALTSAASSNQLATAAYLLPRVPKNVLTTFCFEILKTTAERAGGSLDGVAFLLSANFLGSQQDLYAQVQGFIAAIDRGEEEVMPELADYLRKNWSLESFYEGIEEADDHYVNVMRVLKRGCSEIQLGDLPEGMVIAIALMPLYRKCVEAEGELLPWRLKGELVGSLRRLGYSAYGLWKEKNELMRAFERHLPSFVVSS